jgi:hypothetical protein
MATPNEESPFPPWIWASLFDTRAESALSLFRSSGRNTLLSQKT